MADHTYRRTIFTLLFVSLVILLISGCGLADLGGRMSARTAESSMEGDYAGDEAPQTAKGSSGGVPLDSGSDEGDRVQPELVAVPEKTQQERKRVYSGYARLLVDIMDEEKKRITAVAEESGGYIESSYETAIVIRVPAEDFERIFREILSFGEVLRKSVETVDVTEYYEDLDTRLDIAAKTRERLYRLLEKTDDVEERLKILREIRRLTEEIERIRLTLTLLERRIALSRISVDLVPRLEQDWMDRERIPFDWIAALMPLYPSLSRLKARVDIDLGENFAVFKGSRIFQAESADGTRIRAGTTPNQPAGSAEFWQKALIHHLEDLYRSTKVLNPGLLAGVLFESKDREPFYFFVGVVNLGKHLGILEVFFPDAAAYRAGWTDLLEALESMHFE